MAKGSDGATGLPEAVGSSGDAASQAGLPEGGTPMSFDTSRLRNRVGGFGRGGKAPANDSSWPVPGEVPPKKGKA